VDAVVAPTGVVIATYERQATGRLRIPSARRSLGAGDDQRGDRASRLRGGAQRGP
jgi:hypothetical protein